MIAWLTRFSIRTRTVLLVVIGLAVILALLGYLSVQALWESTAHAFDERLRLAQVAVHHIDDHVEEALALLERTAASEGFDLTDADLEPERHALRELYAGGFFTYEVFVTDRQSRVLWMEPLAPAMTGVDLSAEPEVQHALQTGEPQVGSLVRFHEAEKVKVTFIVPVQDSQGAVIGLIGGAADPTSPFLTGILDALRPVRAGHADVVDRDGMVLASTDSTHVLKESGHKTCLEPMFREGKATVGTYPHIEAGVEKWKDVIAFAPLSAAPWGISIEQPESEALAPVMALRQRLVAIGVAFVILALVLSWLTTQAVVIPIHRLVSASRRIAAGDLATPVVVPGRDEIAELSRAFDEMRCRLQERDELLAAWGQELERQVAERTRELSTLYAITRAAAQSLVLDEILNDALSTVLEVLEVEAGGILLLEPDGETLRLWVHQSLSEAFVQAVQRIKVGEGISGQAVAERKPVVLDVADYPTERLASFVIKEGFQSLVSTPLVSKGVALGALTLGARRLRAFPPEEMELLAAIGRQLGGAVDNARLFEAERRRAVQLALVADIARRAVSILDPDQLLQETANAIQQAFGYYDIILFLVDQETGELTLKTRAGAFERPFPQEPDWKVGDMGIVDWVARHGETLLANDVGREPRYRAFLPGTRSELCVPIKDGERVVAGLNVESDRLYAFDEADVTALEALADELAVALRNAQLFAERQRKITELAALNQIGHALAATLHLDELLELIYQEVTRVLEADAFFIALYDREAGELDYRIQVDMGVREPPERRPPAGQTGLIVSSGEPILIRDFEREKDQYPQVKLWGTMEAPASWLGVPMVVGEQVVGLISVQAYRPEAYDEEHVSLLSTIANQAAVAIENARLYQAMGRRLAELGALFEVSSALRGAETAGEMLPIILDKTLEVVAADAGAIFLVDEAAGEMVVPVARGPMEEALVGRSFPLAGTVTETMLRTGESDISPDLAADPRMPEKMRAMLRGGESGIGLPLRAAGVAVGMMAVGWLGPHTVADDEVRLLTAIADMAASAIHRASLHDRTVKQAQELARLVTELEDTYNATLVALSAALDVRDHATEGHSRRVTELAVTIARAMELPECDVEALMRGALLHDIGKIGVPDSILRKPGRLTDEERAQMQRHTRIGYDMLKEIKFLAPALPVVLCHHERWDGTGYPQGLRGTDIPLTARIFAVADAYDAMTSEHPYRRAMPHAEAIAEIQCEAGKQFDPQVVEVFLQVLRSADGQV